MPQLHNYIHSLLSNHNIIIMTFIVTLYRTYHSDAHLCPQPFKYYDVEASVKVESMFQTELVDSNPNHFSLNSQKSERQFL